MGPWPSPRWTLGGWPLILRRRACRTGESTMVWAKGKTWIGFRLGVLGICLLLMIASVGLGTAEAATTHYIAANGSDSNNGTSTTTPWLHAPGMPNCTGTCASYTPQAGDKFIFRGGDTWHFGNSGASPYTGGTWDVHNWFGTSAATCMYEGTQTGCIYYGVDLTWFSGASW